MYEVISMDIKKVISEMTLEEKATLVIGGSSVVMRFRITGRSCFATRKHFSVLLLMRCVSVEIFTLSTSRKSWPS